MAMPDIGLANWFAQKAARTPKRKALTYEGATLTYGQTQARIESLAARLTAMGVERGARVAYLGLNHPAFLITMFACARIGAAFVPLNFRLAGPEIAYIVNDCGAVALITDTTLRPVAESVRGELANVRQFLAVEGAVPGWEALQAEGAPPVAQVRVGPDDIAVIMYTSGTTGRPKGAMLTHSNLWWNNTNALHAVDVIENDVTLTAAPLFHIGGLNVLTLITLQKGGEVVIQSAFDPGKAIAAIVAHKVTTMFAVPAMFLFMAQHPSFAGADLSSMRSFVCGGAPCPEPLLRLYGSRGMPIQQGYGLTETAPMVSFLSPDLALEKLGSSGAPALFTEVKLIDAAGRKVEEPLARGEICVRGPNVTPGYWNQPAATAAVIDADGWFRTGDIGYFDADGYLTIADRIKDMIISGGENVYPAEVESVLASHPAIAEVAAVGAPDEKWGEIVVAVCALKPGQSLDLETLRAFAGEKLARYKLPQRLEIVEALPRNTTGKILKYQLRDQVKG